VETAIREGKSFGKWGGFISDCAGFDPAFFHISPLEAVTMDPQERIFLETCWAVLEDSGYSRESLARIYHGDVGVFVGITKTGYELYTPEVQAAKQNLHLRTSFSSVANRVSYLLDLHGPSMPIDTMCSSSLTAIHEACEHLIRRECSLAIAGGVNLYLHPSTYTYLASQRMLSTHGKCMSFGAGGDGFVPGEGSGAVLLKPLQNAVRDRDHIYGVIRATSINHSGKTNGYTVPNPAAQRDLVKAALRSGDIHPGVISYIEAHGTGTALGDPVEVDGLTQAFATRADDNWTCAIGSVKSNIGHLESAAGIAGLTKVLLQMQHKVLFPSLHAEQLNPYIDFERTPFRIQRRTEAWRRPAMAIGGGDSQEIPLMAGISSFGAGGANAHMIVEEYLERLDANAEATNSLSPRLIVLSAKNEARLRDRVRELESCLAAGVFADSDLKHIAYTLQVGRDAMESRLAFISATIEETRKKLRDYVAGKAERGEIENFYRGDVSRNQKTDTVFSDDEDLQIALESWIAKGKSGKLLEAWVRGIPFDWSKLYDSEHDWCRRVSLPTYPFSREPYWPNIGRRELGAATSPFLHPLLHRNTSTLAEQRFTSCFTGEEFFLQDHVISGCKVLPAVCYLEMARAALSLSLDLDDTSAINLHDIVWLKPIEVDGMVEVHIALTASDATEVKFEIYTGRRGEETVHARGCAPVKSPSIAPDSSSVIDLAALQARCQQQITVSRCYEIFTKLGLQYGPTHRSVQSLWIENGEKEAHALAHLILPESLRAGSGQYHLHPSTADGAFQAAFGIRLPDAASSDSRPLIPFALNSIRISRAIPESCWIIARSSEAKLAESSLNVDVQICDDAGKVCAALQGLSLRMTRGSDSTARCADAPVLGTDLLLLEPCWKAKTAPTSRAVDDGVYGDRWGFLAAGLSVGLDELGIQCPEVKWSILPVFGNDEDQWASALIEAGKQVLGCIQSVLKDRPQKPVLFQLFTRDAAPESYLIAMSAIFKTAGRENPRLRGQVIVTPAEASGARMAALSRENAVYAASDREVRYLDQHREVAVLREMTAYGANGLNNNLLWKDGGVYVLSGGAAALGLIFAAEIARCAKDVRVIALGRSDLDATACFRLETLAAAVRGARIEYRRCDVSNKSEVTDCIAAILRDHQHITGVLHCAGVLRDGFIIKKNLDDLPIVAAPKIIGALNLDFATRDLDLDMFVLFSSVSGAIGNVGQCDYAFANAFLDRFAFHRNALVKAQQRHGHTLAIDWPLWAEGGMNVDEVTYSVMRRQGIVRLASEDGLRAFEAAWRTGNSQAVLLSGDKLALAEYAGTPVQLADSGPANTSTTEKGTRAATPDNSGSELTRKTVLDLLEFIRK